MRRLIEVKRTGKRESGRVYVYVKPPTYVYICSYQYAKILLIISLAIQDRLFRLNPSMDNEKIIQI